VGRINDVFARNMRAERARLQLTQSEVAERLGWSQGTQSAVELGRRPILLDDVPVICRALGVGLDDMLRGADPEDLELFGARRR
jgi:transcriptional regulator with XRE-family HTH domain